MLAITIVVPTQGCCAKTTIRFKNGQTQKCFINIARGLAREGPARDTI